MDRPRVFADFHNADAQGRLRLNCVGNVEDLARQQITLREGLLLTLYSEDLEVDGQVYYSTEENVWVAVMEALVESIEKIKKGDTRDEVERFLGKADRVTHKEWLYNLDEHSGYLVSFDNEGRVEAVDLWMG